MSDVKQGSVVFVPNGEKVRSLTVTRIRKGKTYVKFPGDNTATGLTDNQFFTDEVKALRYVERGLNNSVKAARAGISMSKRALRDSEKILKRKADARQKVREQIKAARTASAVNDGT